MKVTVTPKVLDWFKKEIVLEEGQGIRFFGKVYGSTQVHEGFSVGMSVDRPERVLFEEEIEGLLFFVDENDDWFFRGYEMTVDLDEKLNEPAYFFTEE
ncbi:HesB/YadR/YfhF family protein [Enterococcus sp. LJL98]